MMLLLSTITLTSSMRSVSLLSLPSTSPTLRPSHSPTIAVPSTSPTLRPSHSPTMPIPTHNPTSSPTLCNMPTQQYDALYALYTSTNGPGWVSKCNNWVFSSTNPDYSASCNGWHGVYCNGQCNVTVLNLPRCQLTGTIPSQLGSLTSIEYLDLDSNSLTGTIPSQLGYMTSMTLLLLYSNNLTGTIPSQFEYMTSLTSLGLNNNSLTGTIPSQLGSMTNLTYLYLYNNSLTGTIPSQLGHMTSMIQLLLNSNRLTGTIPSQLGSLTSMYYLDLYNNSLTGTIPSQLGNMTSMKNLYLFSNNLTGTIPSQLGSLASMQELFLYSNSLTGTIPSQLGSLTSIEYLYLYNNSLTGTIPSQLGNMTTMKNLYLYSNSLIGTIPSQLGSLTSMIVLFLYSNSLTGTIPSQLGSLTIMTYLILNSNSLTGTIPSQLGNMASMKSLFFYSNSLTGTIPSQLIHCTSLRYLYLQNNNLVGSVPSSILTLPILHSIDLSGNQRLGGNITSVFSSNTSKWLTYVIMSSMSLTGSLPSSLFSLPKLNTLVLSSNCITGTLSSSICESMNLSSLILDGIGVGASCSSSRGSRSSFHGYIPSCLFSMPKLSTLHLAGNGLIGTLPEISANSNLTTLSLTSNRLTGIYLSKHTSLYITNATPLLGDIPLLIQMHVFGIVDLSSNKLSGTLVDTYQPSNSSLTLTVNRLSGKAPPSLRATTSTVNIVEGNLFGCPQLSNDVNSKETTCGSSNLEYPIIAWFVLSVLVLLTAVCVLYCKITITIQALKSVSDWWQTSYRCLSSVQYSPQSTELYHTLYIIHYLERACSTTLILVALYMFVAMLSFIAIKLHGSEYTDSLYQVQYLYTNTSAYLVGMTPTVLIWLYVTLSGAVVVLLSATTGLGLYTSSQRSDQQRFQRIDSNDTSAEVYNLDSIKAVTVRVLVSVAVSALAIAINYGFVQIVYVYKPSNLTAVNLAFAIIKTLVNVAVVPYSTKLLPKASRQSHTVLMMIMVSIFSPGVAVLLSSPLCLFNYINNKSIPASYQYLQYVCGTNLCKLQSVPGTCTITPEWFYSYQCSSSYLTSYLPNFIYIYIISGILTPVLNLLTMVLSSSSTRATTTIQLNHRQKQSIVSVISFVLQVIDDNFRVGKIFYIRDGNKETLETRAVSTSVNPISSSVEMSVVDKSNMKSIDGSSSVSGDCTISSRITTVSVDPSSSEDYDIEVAELMPGLCVDITLLLTFGLASPLFAVMVACSIIINTLLWRLALGRYITIVSKATSSRVCYDKLENAFVDEWRCLPRSWWLMSVFIGLFWSLFVNDMIGDKDPRGGIVAAVLMMIWCPCVFISLQWLLSVDPDTDPDSDTGSRLHSIREHVHGMSLRVHDIIWKYVLRLDSISSNSDSSGSSSISYCERISTINETISPIGSLNTTTTNTTTTKMV